MSSPSKYVICHFHTIVPAQDFIAFLNSLETEPKSDQDTLGHHNKCSFLKIKKYNNDKNYTIYSGHFDIWGESHDEIFEETKMIEEFDNRANKVKEKNIFIIAINGTNKHIIAHKIHSKIKNPIEYFHQRFKEYCNNMIDFDSHKQDNIFSQILKLQKISSISIKMSSKDLTESKRNLEIIGSKFKLYNDKTFEQSIKEKIWKEKSSSDPHYCENIKKFSQQYLQWLKNEELSHDNPTLIKYLSEAFIPDSSINLRRIEEAIILATLCKHPSCIIHGYIAGDNRKHIVDIGEIMNGQTVIQVITDKRKNENTIVELLIDQIEILRN